MSSKKVLGIGLSVFMGLSMIGCSNGIDTTEHMVTKECEKTYNYYKDYDFYDINDALSNNKNLDKFKGEYITVTGKVENLAYNEEHERLEGYLDVENNNSDESFKFEIWSPRCDVKFKQGDKITVYGVSKEYSGDFEIDTLIIRK